MPGIDPESVNVLKDAKSGKQVFFALVIKNTTVGKLVANKTGKVPQKKIDEGKQETGGSTVVLGKCHGGDGQLVFQTVKALDNTGQSLAKHLLKEASISGQAVFETNADAEKDGPPTPTTTQPQPQTQPQKTEPSNEERLNKIHHRREVIVQWMQSKKTDEAMRSTLLRVIPVVKQVDEAVQHGDLNDAEQKLTLVENYVQIPPESTSRPGDTTHTTDTTHPTDPRTQGLIERRQHIVQWMQSKKTDESMHSTLQRVIPVVKQVDEAIKGGDLNEAEKQLKLIENYLNLGETPEEQPTTPKTAPPRPQTPNPSVQNYNQAKQGFDNFKTNINAGWNTEQGRQGVQRLKNEMLQIVQDELEGKDDIKRKVGIFDSKDASYKKNVTDVVKSTMTQAQEALANPTADVAGTIRILDEALGLLAIQRAHYADVRDIKKSDTSMLDQRRRKVEAIDSHMSEFRKINGKLRDMLRLKMQPAFEMLSSLPTIDKNSSEDDKNKVKEFAKALQENEQLRKDLFQSAGKDQSEALFSFLRAQPQTESDKWCRELALSRAGDSDFMDDLCKKSILAEAKTAQKGTFFRENSTASKLSSAYAQNSPAGKAYAQYVSSRYNELAKGKGALEVDKAKDKNLTDKQIEKNTQAQAEIMSQIIDDFSSDPQMVPPEIRNLCKTFYDEALRVSDGDEEFATTQSGGFVVLRVINPSLTTANALEVNAIEDEYRTAKMQAKEKWVKSGKKAEDFKYPEMSSSDKNKIAKLQEKQRLGILQTKILQNISNGGAEMGGKEAYLMPLNKQTVMNDNGEFTPMAKKFRGFLKSVAQRN